MKRIISTAVICMMLALPGAAQARFHGGVFIGVGVPGAYVVPPYPYPYPYAYYPYAYPVYPNAYPVYGAPPVAYAPPPPPPAMR